MPRIRLGAVEYLNARPLVYELEQSPRFAVRFDVPSRCADLLHAGDIDLGLIPSIEYLRGPVPYRIVSSPAVASNGPVASVALYTRKDPKDLESIAMDTTSRTSVALMRIVARRAFHNRAEPIPMAPDLEAMLNRADGAVIIGDHALFLDHDAAGVQKIDLGQVWTELTGLPFVYAFWAGRDQVVSVSDTLALMRARDQGLAHRDDIARMYCPAEPARTVAIRYLRDNIQYSLGAEEIEGLMTFYRYASELGLISFDDTIRFYDVQD